MCALLSWAPWMYFTVTQSGANIVHYWSEGSLVVWFSCKCTQKCCKMLVKLWYHRQMSAFILKVISLVYISAILPRNSSKFGPLSVHCKFIDFIICLSISSFYGLHLCVVTIIMCLHSFMSLLHLMIYLVLASHPKPTHLVLNVWVWFRAFK